MAVATERLLTDAFALGASYAGILDMADVRFYPEVRRLCKSNACGAYGKNWMCPPYVGTLEELAARARTFASGLLFQTVAPLADSFDVEGMDRAIGRHRKVVRKLGERLATAYGFRRTLVMGAGACDVCRACTLADGEPCRLPDRAVSSLEAYGMNVKQVVESCGLSYMHGKDTVSYVGLILYDDGAAQPSERQGA